MNSNKWREIQIPLKTVEDLVASHIYAMRGMDSREITELTMPILPNRENMIVVKIKMKEVKNQ